MDAVQLMVYVRNLNEVSISIPYPGIKVTNTHSAGNANYFFIDIEIPVNLPSGEYEIVFRKGYNIVKYN